MRLPNDIPLIAFRPQIKSWFIKNKEMQDTAYKRDVQRSIMQNRREFLHYIRQVKKAARASGIDNDNFLPWLKAIVEIMESENAS